MAENRFDQVATQWDNNPVRRAMGDAVYAAIRATISFAPEHVVLEYGCGTAAFGLRVAPEVRRVIAADSSEGMLAVVRQKIAAGLANNVDVLPLDFGKDGPCGIVADRIITIMALHHVTDPQTVLHRFAGCLAPGGVLAIADLYAEDGSFHGPEQPVPHNGFVPEELRDTMLKAGFENIRWAEVHRVRKPVGDSMGEFPMFLMTATPAR